MKQEDIISISKDRFADLLICEEELLRLEQGGVDNWSYYSESLNPEESDDYDTMCARIRKEVKNGS